MKLLIMKHTIPYLAQEAKAGNSSAIEQLAYYDTMDIVEKEKYVVLTEKTV